jgi:hypothetical protein
MGKVKSADAAAGHIAHDSVSLIPAFFSTSSRVPENLLFCVVRTRRVTRRGADPPIFLFDQVIGRQMFLPAVTPFLTHAFVEPFCKCLGEPIRPALRS